MPDDIHGRLRSALTDAMRSRDTAAVAAFRLALSALGNAEAVPQAPGAGSSPVATSEHVAGAVLGVGGAEVPRRVLDDAEADRVVRAEAAALGASAEAAERSGHTSQAARRRAEAAALTRVLDAAG